MASGLPFVTGDVPQMEVEIVILCHFFQSPGSSFRWNCVVVDPSRGTVGAGVILQTCEHLL